MALYDCVKLELQIDRLDAFKDFIKENLGESINTFYGHLGHILLYQTEHWQGSS